MSPESTPPDGGDAPVEGAAPATPETAGPPPDFDRIYERMDEMSSQQQQIAEQLGQVYERTEPVEYEEEPEFYDETGELTEDGVRAVVDDYVREQIQAQMAPMEAQRQIEDRDAEWDILKEEVPQLQDPKYAQEIIGQAVEWAARRDPGLIETPEFIDVIEMFHKSRMADEFSASQTPAGPGVVLESAQGAAQPAKGSQVDWGDRIVKAAERLRPQI